MPGQSVAGTKKEPTLKRKKLLVCAPSNAAIDEIARRLIKGIKDSSGRPYLPSLIRIGNEQSIHPEVLPISLNRLVDLKSLAPSNSAEIEKEIESLRTQLKKVNKDDIQTVNSIATKLANLDKARKGKTYDSRGILYSQYIKAADVVLCTLSGAGSEILSTINGLEFESVIIDEACQGIIN
jgi:senataxin